MRSDLSSASIRRQIGIANIAVTWMSLFFSQFLNLQKWSLLLAALWISFSLSAPTGYLPEAVVLLLSTGLLGGFFYFVVKGLWRQSLPRLDQVLRQIEEANHLKNRPLRSLRDHLSSAHQQNTASQSLWNSHRDELKATLRNLSWGWFRPNIAALDPFALRHLCLCLLIILGFMASQGFLQSAKETIWPITVEPPLIAKVDAWVTPPNYTGIATFILPQQTALVEDNPESFRREGVLPLPAGSEITLQINLASVTPELFINDQKSDANFTSLSADSFSLTHEITQDGIYDLRIEDDTKAIWAFNTLPDLPPEISFFGEIGTTSRQSLRLPYKAHDDYGIQEIDIRLTRSVGDKNKIVQLPLIKGQGQKRDMSSNYFLDLTAHPWAGLQVQAELVVKDALNQIGSSKTQLVVIPQKVFTHPVARQIIAIRKSVSAAATSSFHKQAQELVYLAYQGEAYNNQTAIFMGLYMSARRLTAPDVELQTRAVLNLLWEMALYLEEGEISTALEKLKLAEKALTDALNRGASAAELQQLMDQLQQAINDYMKALAEAAQHQAPQDGLTQKPEKFMNSSSIQEMMDQLRDMLKMGMTDAAQQMLSNLQNIMQNLQQADNAQLPQEVQESMDMLQEMEALMQAQQDLLERSHDRAMGRSNDNNSNGNPSLKNTRMRSEADIQAQAALQEQLNALRQKYEKLTGQKIPDSFFESGSAMEMAGHSLNEGNNHDAANFQGQALNALQQALGQMEETLIEKFMNSGMQALTTMPTPNGQGQDPFGRSAPNPLSGSGNEEGRGLPSEDSISKARSIQQELRRRFKDKSRDDNELDYIERLLNPF